LLAPSMSFALLLPQIFPNSSSPRWLFMVHPLDSDRTSLSNHT
jgi:hypothetical protein